MSMNHYGPMTLLTCHVQLMHQYWRQSMLWSMHQYWYQCTDRDVNAQSCHQCKLRTLVNPGVHMHQYSRQCIIFLLYCAHSIYNEASWRIQRNKASNHHLRFQYYFYRHYASVDERVCFCLRPHQPCFCHELWEEKGSYPHHCACNLRGVSDRHLFL